MKKLLSLALVLLLMLSLSVGVFAGAETAVLSNQSLSVNGEPVDCEKYNIDGSNFFKLRDLAYLLIGTEAQFDVGYDAASATVTITTGEFYMPVGTELAVGVDNSATAVPSAQTIRIDGKVVSDLTVYNIGGSNFFMLRDLAAYVGFEVDYDAATRTVLVDSPFSVFGYYRPVHSLEITTTNGADPEILEETWDYDEYGNVLTYYSESSCDGNRLERTSTYSYNADGQESRCETRERMQYGNGKVEEATSVTEYEYSTDADGGQVRTCKIDGEWFSTYVFYLDITTGDYLGYRYTDADGYMDAVIYHYDEDGNLICEEYISSDTTVKIDYDGDGMMLSKYCTYADGSSWQAEYSYDSAGRLHRIRETSDGEVNVTTYTYRGDTVITKDALGTLTSTTEYAADGSRTESELYEPKVYYAAAHQTLSTYDANGYLTSCTLFYPDYSVIEHYSYDEDGNMTFYSYEYEEDGQTVSASLTYYVYDAAGNCIEETGEQKDAGGETYTSVTRREYDENGNLVKMEMEETDDLYGVIHTTRTTDWKRFSF